MEPNATMPLRYLVALLAVLLLTSSAEPARAQVGNNALLPGNDQLKFQQLSGPYDNPVVWRVLMNEYMYRRFITTGLAAAGATGPVRPSTWLGLQGRYFPMQYIGRWGTFHELRLVQQMPQQQAPAAAVSPQQGGCCSWIAPNVGRTCGPTNYQLCTERSGQFTPNGICGPVPGGFCAPP